MKLKLIHQTFVLLFVLSGLNSDAQFPNPVIYHNGVESELLARVGDKLFIYNPYDRVMYSTDSFSLSVVHDFMFSSRLPSLGDYCETPSFLYMSGVLDPTGSYDYFILYRTDGITLDTMYMYSSLSTLYPGTGILESYNDTLYFLQRDSLMMVSPLGVINNLGTVYHSSTISRWNDKIMVFENDGGSIDIKIFDTQSMSFVRTINMINDNDPSLYLKPVFNNQFLYCDSNLKFIDPLTLNDYIIDSSLYYHDIIGTLNNSTVICFAEDKAGLYGSEIYSVDLNTQQASLLKDIQPGPASSSYSTWQNGSAVPGRTLIYFYADDGVHGTEWWVTDGTTAGTHMIVDYEPGPDGLAPGSYGCQYPSKRIHDYSYIRGDTLITGFEPYSGNAISHFGVTNGTQFYAIDIDPSNNGNERIKYFKEFKGNVYFTTEITPAPWGHLCRFDSSFVTGISILNTVQQMEIYPNPTKGEFTLDLRKQYKDVSIKILNTLGEVVSHTEMHSISRIELELNNPPGVYFVSIIADGQNNVMKITRY